MKSPLKLCILAIAGLFASCLLPASGASALDGQPLSDYLNNQPSTSELLGLLNLGTGAEGCGSANNESQINCEETGLIKSLVGDDIDDANHGNAIIRKVNESGQPLEGVRFTIDGIKAENIGGIYYVAQKGIHDSFVTNEFGEIIIKGLPIGEYTIREVETSAGYDPIDPMVLRVTKDTISSRPYHRESVAFNAGENHQDLTNNVLILPDGTMTMPQGVDVELTWNEDAERYEFDYASTAYIAPGTDESGKYLALVEEDEDPVLMYYDSVNHLYGVKKYMPDGRSVLTIGLNGEMTGDFFGTPITLEYNSERDEYVGGLEGDDAEISAKLLDNRIILTTSSVEISGYVYTYDEATGGYVRDYYLGSMYSRALNENTITYGQYYDFTYLQDGDYVTYLMGVWTMRANVSFDEDSLQATELTITNTKHTDVPADDTPEEATPTNPQTADAILKAIAIAIIGTIPAIIMRKQLTKR